MYRQKAARTGIELGRARSADTDMQDTVGPRAPHAHHVVFSDAPADGYVARLTAGWHVDQAILSEEDRVVVLRFGHDWVRRRR